MVQSQSVSWSSIPDENLKWKQEASGTNEGMTFYILTKENAFLLIQLVYSSLNSWSPTAQIFARAYLPDGSKKSVSSYQSGSSLIVSDDKFSAKCDTFSITRKDDPADTGPERKLTYEVSFIHQECTVHAVFESVDGGFQVGDSTKLYKQENPSAGWVGAQYAPRMSVSGHFAIDGTMYDANGKGFFIHLLHNQPQNALHWNFSFFQSPEATVFLHALTLPSDPELYDDARSTWASLYLGDQIDAVMTESETEYGPVSLDDFSGYDIPKSLIHRLKGQSRDGSAVEVELKFDLTKLADKIDVLAELPYLLRVFVQTFITSPFVYQWVQDATITVKKAGIEPREISGRAFVEESFLNQV